MVEVSISLLAGVTGWLMGFSLQVSCCRRDADAIVSHSRTSTPSPDSRVVTFKAARNNRAYEFSSGELAEQAPRGKKINSFKAFGELVVNPFQQLDGLPLAALI